MENIREELVSNVVDDLSASINKLDLDLRNFYREPPPTIHQIPISVRKGNKSAYTPKYFSIGPYHLNVHQGSYLHEQTKGVKILYLKDFLRRTGKDVKHYASPIEPREEEARDCYHDRCDQLTSKEFVQMLVLDGCFIIEFLLKFYEQSINDKNMRKWWWRHLRNDLMLMENQIPFFILKLILDSSHLYNEVQGDDRNFGILDLCLHFLHQGKITTEMLEPTHQEEGSKNVYHLLHLSYLCHMVEIIPEREPPPETLEARRIEKLKSVLYLSAYLFLFLIKFFLLSFFSPFIFLLNIMWHKRDMHQKVRAEEKTKKIPTATELNESGVTFRRKTNAKITDVSFKDTGIMEIPVVRIDDSSSSTFRNYLALEQNCPTVGNEFTGYALFMEYLIDTASDVALLKKRKIIVSMLGSDEEVAKLFNGIAAGLVFDYRDYYLSDNIHLEKLFDDADSYSTRNRYRWRVIINKLRRKIDKWMAMLIRDYFSSPWKVVSLLGAATLLAFGATQVAYAVKNSR